MILPEGFSMKTIKKLITAKEMVETNSFYPNSVRPKEKFEIDFNSLYCNVPRKYLGCFYDLKKQLCLWVGFYEKLGLCISFYLKNRDLDLEQTIKSLGYRYSKEYSKIDQGFWFSIKLKHMKNKQLSLGKRIDIITNDILSRI